MSAIHHARPQFSKCHAREDQNRITQIIREFRWCSDSFHRFTRVLHRGGCWRIRRQSTPELLTAVDSRSPARGVNQIRSANAAGELVPLSLQAAAIAAFLSDRACLAWTDNDRDRCQA